MSVCGITALSDARLDRPEELVLHARNDRIYKVLSLSGVACVRSGTWQGRAYDLTLRRGERPGQALVEAEPALGGQVWVYGIGVVLACERA